MSDGFVKLIGENVQHKEETISTSSVTAKATAVGLYFSAHWCPPCRGFTPKLAEWYNKFKASSRGDELEIIFVSSDRDEESFKEYYGEQPWHALPYEDRKRKEALSKKFKVSGIPTLVIVDAKTGDIICKNARGKMAEDPEGALFPWQPQSLSDMLKGDVLTKDGEKNLATLTNGRVTGIYFSAHWCPPCRTFTPELVKFYNKLNQDETNKKFEIVFVSWDKEQQQFEEYFKDMPWTAFPLNDPRAKGLATHFEVEGIPSLIIIDEDKKVVTSNGRSALSADPEGKEFPWHPKSLNELSSMAAGLINEAAALIYLTGSESQEKENKARELMQPIADQYFARRKADPNMEELNFFYEGQNSKDLPDSVRQFAGLGDDSPILFIINIPDQQKYIHTGDDITSAVLQDIISKFQTSTLPTKALRG